MHAQYRGHPLRVTLSERALIQRFEPLACGGDRLLLFVALRAGDGVHSTSPSVQTRATAQRLRQMEAKSLTGVELGRMRAGCRRGLGTGELSDSSVRPRNRSS